MIKIVISLLIIILVNGEDCTLNVNEIEKIQKSFSEAEALIKNSARNEKAIIFLGLLKSGKSTLINYLIGNQLRAKRHFNVLQLIRVGNETEGPKIGNSVTSQTAYVSPYKSNKVPNLSLWDTPGFDDNRGQVQDISNAFYIYHLVKNVKTLRTILVFDFNGIKEESVELFLKLLKFFETIFQSDFTKLFSSVSIIFTKVGDMPENFLLNTSDIATILESKILNASLRHDGLKLSQFGKDFLKFLIANTNHIGIFRKVEHEGIISPQEIDDNIISSIRNSRNVKGRCLQHVNASISEKSVTCLHAASEELQSFNIFANYQNTVNEVFSSIINIFNKTVETVRGRKKFIVLETLKRNLTVHANLIQSVLQATNDLPKKVNILQRVTKNVDEDDLLKKITQLQFIDTILNTRKYFVIESGIKLIMNKAKMRLKILISEIDVDLNMETIETLEDKKKRIINECLNAEQQIQNEIQNLSEVDKKNKFFDNLIRLVNLLTEGLKKTKI